MIETMALMLLSTVAKTINEKNGCMGVLHIRNSLIDLNDLVLPCVCDINLAVFEMYRVQCNTRRVKKFHCNCSRPRGV